MARLRWMENARTGDKGTQCIGDLDISGDLTVDGTLNYGAVGLTLAQQLDNALTVGVDGTGYDVQFYGAGSTYYWKWDEDASSNGGVVMKGTFVQSGNMSVTGTFALTGGATISTTLAVAGNTSVTAGTLTVGVSAAGRDVKFWGDTAGYYWLWDSSADTNGGVELIGTMDITGNVDIDGNVQMANTDKIYFYDTSQYIYASADEILDIVAATVAITGDVTVSGSTSFGGLGIGSSGTPATYVYGEPDFFVYTTCAATDNTYTAVPSYFSAVMTNAGGVGRAMEAVLSVYNVKLGGWSNAIKGMINFNATGSITGLASAICAEMTLPTGAQAGGTYAPLEIEMTCPATWVPSGAQYSLIYAGITGSTKTTFDTNGNLMQIEGLSAGSGSLLYNNTLRIRLDGTAYYIPLSTTQGTYTTPYAIVCSLASGTALDISGPSTGIDVGACTYGLRFTGTCGTSAITIGTCTTSNIAISGTNATGIAMTGTYSGHGIAIGVSGAALDLVEKEDRLLSIWGSSNATGGNVMPLYVSMASSGLCKARAAEFVLTPTAKLGDWATTIKAYLDLTGAPGAQGMASAICAEVLLPNEELDGNLYPLELEMVAPDSAFEYGAVSPIGRLAFILMQASGTTIGEFDDYGYLMTINGLDDATTHLWFDNTLRIGVDGTAWYIPLSSAEASYTTAYPVSSSNITGFATTATFVPDATRTNYAYSIGNRAGELTVDLDAAADQNFEPFQMNINLTADSGEPTGSSTVRLLRIRSTHDSVDMDNLRIMNINTYMDVQRNMEAAYGIMNGVDFTVNTVVLTTEAAVAAFNMECTSTVTGSVRGIIVNMHGATLPSTSIGVEVRTDGGSATLGEGIRIWSVGGNSITTGLDIRGTVATGISFAACATTCIDLPLTVGTLYGDGNAALIRGGYASSGGHTNPNNPVAFVTADQHGLQFYLSSTTGKFTGMEVNAYTSAAGSGDNPCVAGEFTARSLSESEGVQTLIGVLGQAQTYGTDHYGPATSQKLIGGYFRYNLASDVDGHAGSAYVVYCDIAPNVASDEGDYGIYVRNNGTAGIKPHAMEFSGGFAEVFSLGPIQTDNVGHAWNDSGTGATEGGWIKCRICTDSGGATWEDRYIQLWKTV